MKNYIKFHVGDLVCLKDSDPIDTIPFVVKNVVPDPDYDNRVGDCGNSNEYDCEKLKSSFRPDLRAGTRRQFELCYWCEQQDEVIAYFRKYLQNLLDL